MKQYLLLLYVLYYLYKLQLKVKFAREYDMDSGLSGTATCNVSVRDVGGFSDSGNDVIYCVIFYVTSFQRGGRISLFYIFFHEKPSTKPDRACFLI